MLLEANKALLSAKTTRLGITRFSRYGVKRGQPGSKMDFFHYISKSLHLFFRYSTNNLCVCPYVSWQSFKLHDYLITYFMCLLNYLDYYQWLLLQYFFPSFLSFFPSLFLFHSFLFALFLWVLPLGCLLQLDDTGGGWHKVSKCGWRLM